MPMPKQIHCCGDGWTDMSPASLVAPIVHPNYDAVSEIRLLSSIRVQLWKSYNDTVIETVAAQMR